MVKIINLEFKIILKNCFNLNYSINHLTLDTLILIIKAKALLLSKISSRYLFSKPS